MLELLEQRVRMPSPSGVTRSQAWLCIRMWDGVTTSTERTLPSIQPHLCCHKHKYHCPKNPTNLQHTLITADSCHDKCCWFCTPPEASETLREGGALLHHFKHWVSGLSPMQAGRSAVQIVLAMLRFIHSAKPCIGMQNVDAFLFTRHRSKASSSPPETSQLCIALPLSIR
eukprot:1161833-Pelagomonas_calceolata.AAC.1